MAVIVRSFAGADASSGELSENAPRALRAVYDLMVAAIPILLAVLFTWVAFGPGERHFTVSGGSGGSAVAMPVSGGGQIIGRVAFGFAAALGWVIAGLMGLNGTSLVFAALERDPLIQTVWPSMVASLA